MPQILPPQRRDLGDFEVARLLPAAARRSIGPFVFLDRMGPARLGAGRALDVRPHPHIGLATLTWLFEGAITHRDSLGSRQEIHPGDVNWMVAGRGVVHSERTPQRLRATEHGLDGLQCWLALPQEAEEVAPRFDHHPAAELPVVDAGGTRVVVVAGEAFGLRSPVPVYSPTVFATLQFEAGASLALPAEHAESALYPYQGELSLAGERLANDHLHVLEDGRTPMLRADSAARAVLLGGAPLDAPRHLWWNFVSSSRDRIEQAKADWQAERFEVVPGDDERIPLPER